jgi:hypothetical protein
MPLINDNANTRSIYPRTLDAFPAKTNGVGSNSVIDANTWNNIESALYRLQSHTQKTVLFFDSADRHRVCVSGTTTISTGASLATLLLTPTAAQLAFLNGGVQRSGAMIIADVVSLNNSDDCTANVTLGTSSVTVTIFRTDPTQTFTGGSYLVNVTILGY